MKNPGKKKMVRDVVAKPRLRAVKVIVPASRGLVRAALSIQRQALALFLALMLVLVNAQAFVAFEAHVVDVKAEVARVDAPTITPPGGEEYSSSVEVTIESSDPDATHIFYTVTPGLNPNTSPDPDCSGANWGGQKPILPITLGSDSVLKAVACTGQGADAHSSIVALAIFDFPQLYAGIQGHKYHDLDKDGEYDAGLDFPIQGWGMYLLNQDDSVASSTITDASGWYLFKGVASGIYTLKEESRPGWEHTNPDNWPIEITGSEAEVYNFFNYDTGFACVPKDVSFVPGLAVQAAGVSTDNDDVTFGANVTVNGDIFSNDDIERMSGAPNVHVNGSATSTGEVDDGIAVSKMTLEGAPAGSLPDVMISEWIDRARDGGTVNGSFNFPNNTTGLLLGPSEIKGNVAFGNSNTATIKGPLYINGNLTIGSNTVLTGDAGFGDQFLPIVVDGTVDVASGASFAGSGTKGAFLIISKSPAVDGDDASINIDSGSGDAGDAVFYSSMGDIHVGSGRTVLSLYAAHGTGDETDDNAAVRIDANSTVTIRELPSKISCGPRQPYESTSHVVINEFVPNPAGDDTALKPDGEWTELFNPTGSNVDVNGWVLYDSVNTNELIISAANTDTGATVIAQGEHLVVYRNGDSDFALNNTGGDAVRLFTAEIGSGGILVDSHTYTASAADDKSFARIPDGSSNWIDPEATPGNDNMFFFELLDPGMPAFNPAPKPELAVETHVANAVPSQAEESSGGSSEDGSLAGKGEEHAKVEDPPEVQLPDSSLNPEKDGDSASPTSTPADTEESSSADAETKAAEPEGSPSDGKSAPAVEAAETEPASSEAEPASPAPAAAQAETAPAPASSAASDPPSAGSFAPPAAASPETTQSTDTPSAQ